MKMLFSTFSVAAFAFATVAAAQPALSPPQSMPPRIPGEQYSRPAEQTRFSVHLDGVSAVQLAWWFMHMADEDGRYWKPLAPATNTDIQWRVNPREDAHQIIGAIFTSDQKIGHGLFPQDTLHTQAQFQDYVTQRGGYVPGQPAALNPTLPLPRDYTPPYPSPPALPSFFAPLPPGTTNGFNQQLILEDGMGFAPGRMFISWHDSGSDDTPATASKPVGVDLTITVYQHWMEGPNRPPALKADGYYYTPAQVQAIGAAWSRTFSAMPTLLPGWFNADTQDDIARSKGWTVSGEIDTGFVRGVDSKMMVWWWNHAMGDAPGITYSFWCPPAHYAIRWIPGYSPAEVLKSSDVPTDHVVPGAIYPDLQGGSLIQTGGGMMSYPPSMSPITGRYKTIDPMFVISKEQFDNLGKDRFPQTRGWLLHQWEDRPGGMIHRSTTLAHLPLLSPITQQGFYSEHQLMEGQFWGTDGMRRAYAEWLSKQPSK